MFILNEVKRGVFTFTLGLIETRLYHCKYSYLDIASVVIRAKRLSNLIHILTFLF